MSLCGFVKNRSLVISPRLVWHMHVSQLELKIFFSWMRWYLGFFSDSPWNDTKSWGFPMRNVAGRLRNIIPALHIVNSQEHVRTNKSQRFSQIPVVAEVAKILMVSERGQTTLKISLCVLWILMFMVYVALDLYSPPLAVTLGFTSSCELAQVSCRGRAFSGSQLPGAPKRPAKNDPAAFSLRNRYWCCLSFQDVSSKNWFTTGLKVCFSMF